MSAQDLLDGLKDAGLTIRTETGWKSRGSNWAVGGGPEGLMQHHTGPPASSTTDYPIARLYDDSPGGQLKANMATHRDGTVYLIAYGSCNYSSGAGSRVVLDEVRASTPPSANAAPRGLVDDMGGNRHYWNYENSHPGDGSPISRDQLDAIVISSDVVAEHFGLSWAKTISHAEHTRRKIDPYWSGSNRTAIEQIREEMREMATYRGVKNVPDQDWAKKVVDNGIDTWKYINVEDTHTDDWQSQDYYDGRLWIFLNRVLTEMHPERLQ